MRADWSLVCRVSAIWGRRRLKCKEAGRFNTEIAEGTEVTEIPFGYRTKRRRPPFRTVLLKFISRPTLQSLSRRYKELRFVHGQHPLDRFYFENRFAFDNDVGTVGGWSSHILINNRERHFAGVRQAGVAECPAEALGVNASSNPEAAVHLDAEGQ